MNQALTGLIVASGVSLMATVSFTSGVGFIETANSLYDTRPRILTVSELSYSNDHFRQHIEAINGPIRAEWAARIARGDRVLCSGGGEGLYSGTPVTFTPSEWTGDSCPALLPGDVATGTWEWRTREGNIASVSSTIVIPSDSSHPSLP